MKLTDRQFNLVHGLFGTALSLVTVFLCICNLAGIALPRWGVIIAIAVVAISDPVTLWGAVKLIIKERKKK